MHITVLRVGPADAGGRKELLVEVSPVNCTSIEDDRKFWEEQGEDPDIVVAHQELNLSEQAEDCVNDLLAQGEPELLEEVLNALFKIGQQFPNS